MANMIQRCEISLEKILTPLSLNNGVGSYLRYEAVYDEIKFARQEDDDRLSQGIWQTELKRADWGSVEKLTYENLIQSSKDLQLIGWLCESWVVLDSFSGALKGIELIESFCNQFWDHFYPQTEDQDIEPRLFIFEWIDQALSERFIFLPITQKLDHLNLKSLSLADWIEATSFDKIAKRSSDSKKLISEAESKGKITLNRFRKSLQYSQKNYLEENLKILIQLSNALENLKANLFEKLKNQAPTFSLLKNHIETCIRILGTTLEQRKNEIIEKQQRPNDSDDLVQTLLVSENQEDETHSSKKENSDSNEGEIIAQRSQAYRALHELSKFLKNVDPHSPAPYLLDLIVSWENKTLIQIIGDIAEGKTPAHSLLKTLAKTAPNS